MNFQICINYCLNELTKTIIENVELIKHVLLFCGVNKDFVHLTIKSQ